MNFKPIHAGIVAAVVCAAIVLSRGLWPSAASAGFIQINTVPASPLTQTALFLGDRKLSPIRQGGTLLRQSVGTATLQTSDFTGAMQPLCAIEVKRDRITTVTVSVLDRPPRCQCRFNGSSSGHTCVS